MPPASGLQPARWFWYRLCWMTVFALPSGSLAQSPVQTQTDSYTRYELQAPATQSFRIVYDVSATTPGARYYFNSIREGAAETVHGVTDLLTGRPLEWDVVDGTHARASGHPTASRDNKYIKVRLARPVPVGGQGRIRIDKTYTDPQSYWSEGGEITFSRSLGIRRNSVVLPLGYEVIESNYPSQVLIEADGRLKVSFMSPGPRAIAFIVRARPVSRSPVSELPPTRQGREVTTETRTVPSGARIDYVFSERAYQDRDIVYFLLQPETHSFRLYHDYTETRAGVDRYLNIVRPGSRATNPSARILDTGEELRVETLRGNAITNRGITLDGQVTAETEVVAIWFDPVQPGHSIRLRIEETYTDPNRYLLVNDELVWDRSFGRPRNTVVLPAGWFLTANSIPAVVSETDDGLVSLRFINDRPGSIPVFIKAKRR